VDGPAGRLPRFAVTGANLIRAGQGQRRSVDATTERSGPSLVVLTSSVGPRCSYSPKREPSDASTRKRYMRQASARDDHRRVGARPQHERVIGKDVVVLDAEIPCAPDHASVTLVLVTAVTHRRRWSRRGVVVSEMTGCSTPFRSPRAKMKGPLCRTRS